MGKPLWTVMIYLSGDNNLTEEMILALKEIQRVPPNDDVKVVAQFDPSGLGVPTRRYDFSETKPGRLGDGNLDRFAVDEPIVLGDTNTGNPEALSDFIAWAHTRYESENNFLILSGHGSGAEGDFLLKDDSSGDSLTIAELQWALCNARVPIRILGLDNCLMSNAEVIDSVSRHYSGRNGKTACTGDRHVDFVVASEGFAPTQGWPYHRFLDAIREQPQTYLDRNNTVDTVLELVVDGYGRFYSDYDFAAGESTDVAAVEVGKIAAICEKLKTLARVLRTRLEDRTVVGQLVLAHWYSQTYKFGQYVDLRDFCELLRDGSAAAADALRKDDAHARSAEALRAISLHCDAVVEAVAQCVVRACCTGPRVQHSYGLSLYFPWAVVHESYSRLSLPQESGWYDFLLEYLKTTRRKGRHRGDRYAVHPTLQLPAEQRSQVQKVFKKRKRSDLSLSLGLGFMEAPASPSSYASSRNAEKRYISSRHATLRFQPGASDLQPVTQWIQNPATGSGATCYIRADRDDSPLKRDETPDDSVPKDS